LVRARQVAMYILKKDLGLTFVEIGNILGGRDHTTVMHGVEKVEKMVDEGGFSQELLGIKNYEGGKLARY
jgi:chromosomal replication initiator protein